MKKVSILGAGMAGFGAAFQLEAEGVPSIVYEKDPYHGGHAASFLYDGGYVFDDGPHVSFTRDSRIRDLFAQSVNGEYFEIPARLNNFWKGYWIRHPAQLNLYGLPADLQVRILRDFIEGRNEEVIPAGNYAEWLIANFGRSFAETFPMEYALKIHTTAAENLTADWMGPRMYKPKLDEVLLGALSAEHPNVHYVTDIRYPRENGFVSYLNMFLKMTDLRLGRKVEGIDTGARELRFRDGTVERYEGLISSIPLTDLVPMISGVPADVLESAGKLACSSLVTVNIGVEREDLSGFHFTYFYDREIPFSRVSFPHMFSPSNVPRGTGSIQAEIYFSPKYKPLDRSPEDCIDPVLSDLRRCGLLREDDRILFRNARYSAYANVIFDHQRAAALAAVHGYLEDVGIAWCGRYGEWAYLWTDESFISGEKAAKKVLDRSIR